jgi:hypothetical protein
MSTTDKIASIFAKAESAPRLSPEESAAYDRIFNRLARASADLRRAKKRGDAKLLASAQRRMESARADRAAIIAPHVDHLHAPVRILCTFESRWSGPGVVGNHLQVCEMVLDHKELSGPEYRTVRVLRDEGGPPTIARTAPDSMGVAWFALNEQIARGKIVVLDEEELS